MRSVLRIIVVINMFICTSAGFAKSPSHVRTTVYFQPPAQWANNAPQLVAQTPEKPDLSWQPIRMQPSKHPGWSHATINTHIRDFVFTDGSTQWDRPADSNYRNTGGAKTLWVSQGRIYRRQPLPGVVKQHMLPWEQRNEQRKISVYLPPGYEASAHKKYRVIYMQDGQNLFDRNAWHGGWQVDAAADAQYAQGQPGVIIVGIHVGDNPAARIRDYTPWANDTFDGDEKGGGANDYLDFVTTQVMPWVEQNFRVKTGPKHTTIAGSSLGGLLSLYAGLTRPDRFGNVIAMSPSLWWAKQAAITTLSDMVQNAASQLKGNRRPLNIYIDHGNIEDGGPDAQTWLARWQDVIADKPLSKKFRLTYRNFDHHTHNEAAWRARLPSVLQLLNP